MSSYTEGQVHQLMNKLEAGGFTSEDLTKLGQYKNLLDIRGLLRGTHELKLVDHLINCDADPFIPNDWKVEEHRKGGQLQWDSNRIKLYLSKKQRNGSIEGNKLRKELADQPVLNANVLDYLLAHPDLIPEEWKDKFIFFWGTFYRNSYGSLVVRYLYWNGGRWDWSCGWLDDGWGSGHPAVLLAS